MPKLPHEALVQLVRNAPSIIPSLVWPERQVNAAATRVSAAEFVDLNLAEYRADAVVVVGDDPKRPTMAFVVEAQTEVDPRKRWTWPLYVAGPRVRLACPVVLVVLALDREVAAWCAEPIDLGEGCCILRPRVLGPDTIPRITDFDEARATPELAVLSVAAHASEPGVEEVALAALAAAHGLDRERGTFYPDFVLALLGSAARAALEQLMSTTGYQYQSDFARKYFAEGEAKGKAEGKAEGEARLLLKLLELRGFAVSDELRRRVLECTECAVIETWAGRVLTAKSLDEVFAEE
ncbi:MAG: hypothetical protein H6711_26750 [Myxococcales bacterium]|nr:hypothetical protein [Myxococcales bacterium]